MNLSNEIMSINTLKDILGEKLFVVFNPTDTAIALSVIDSLDEMSELFIFEHEEVSAVRYQMIIADFFALAETIINKYV